MLLSRNDSDDYAGLSCTERHTFRVVPAVGGGFIVLAHGLQWGKAPFDRSGASSEVFSSREFAIAALRGVEGT